MKQNNKLPYKIKLTPYRPNHGSIMHRQTREHKLLSDDGRYQFYIGNDDDDEEFDFWVVQGKGIRHATTSKIAPENTILLTTEPRSILVYPQQYLEQFGMIHTNQENTNHGNIVYGHAVLPWFVGYKDEGEGLFSYSLDYDMLKQAKPPIKTKLISVITSNKSSTKGHIERLEFVSKLKQHYGDKLDVFGRGFNDFDDKWDVLAPYKYHIVIENSSTKYYWTEKIADCFLAQTYPIYYGCTNLADYFPTNAYTAIDILDAEKAIATIDSLIAEKAYEQKQDLLEQCKYKIVGEYNMFNYIAWLCDKLNPDLPKKEIVLKPSVSVGNFQNLFNYTIKRNYYKLKNKFLNIFTSTTSLK